MVSTFNRVWFERLTWNKASGLEPVLSHLTLNALFISRLIAFAMIKIQFLKEGHYDRLSKARICNGPH